MALEHVAGIMVKMQESSKNNIDLHAASYFDLTFKSHFKQLEKIIQNNWRLHKAFYEALG
jgi:hypothetical protein